jgi:hypothetical protein
MFTFQVNKQGNKIVHFILLKPCTQMGHMNFDINVIIAIHCNILGAHLLFHT